MSKYEADTKYIFVNTENLEQRDGGDQVNTFKLNLGANPINADDNSLIKISLTQFDMNKNFFNVNDTNNSLRIHQDAFTEGNFQVSAFDTIIKLDVGDYITFEALLFNLCNAIKTVYTANVNADTTVTVTPNSNGNTIFNSANEANGAIYSGTYLLNQSSVLTKPNTHHLEFNTGLYSIKIKFTRSSGNAFVAANVSATPFIECLHIPPNEGQVTLSSGQVLTANEQYNDSYILLGIPRQTTYIDNPSAIAGGNNTFIALNKHHNDTDCFTLFNTYPITQGLHTCSNVFLRANLNTSLATTNYENLSHSHQGNIAQSHILGKIPRVSATEGHRAREIVVFKQEDIESQSMVITQNMINEITFSITDSRGRVLPAVPAQVRLFGLATSDFPSVPKQNRVGNLFANFTLKIERLSIPFAPNVLQGTPDIKRVSVNSVSNSIPLKNNGCGF